MCHLQEYSVGQLQTWGSADNSAVLRTRHQPPLQVLRRWSTFLAQQRAFTRLLSVSGPVAGARNAVPSQGMGCECSLDAPPHFLPAWTRGRDAKRECLLLGDDICRASWRSGQQVSALGTLSSAHLPPIHGGAAAESGCNRWRALPRRSFFSWPFDRSTHICSGWRATIGSCLAYPIETE